MSANLASPPPRPALALKLTTTLGLVLLTVGIVFTSIYFVLSVSLFSRVANQELETLAKSAESIVSSVAKSRERTNGLTFIRNLQNAGLSDHIGIYDKDKRLTDHSDEHIAQAIGKLATNPKARIREIEEQKRLLTTTLKYAKSHPKFPLFKYDHAYYAAFVVEERSILVGLTPHTPNMIVLAVSFFLLCLLGVAIDTLFVYQYGRSIAKTLMQIVRGLEVDSLRVDTIDPQYQEIAELVVAVGDKLHTTHPQMAQAPAAQNDDIFQRFQNKLFEKPFPRMERYELAVYPRRPKLGTKEFISGSHDHGHVDVLIGITESDAAEALLLKHRLQERFWTLGKQQLPAAAMAHDLWSMLFFGSEYVPGLFFARLDEAERTLDVYRAGGVHLFEVVAPDNCREIDLGSEQFGSEFTTLATLRLAERSHFVMISHEAFGAMELSKEDFTALLGKIGGAQGGKRLLAGILEKIHQKLPAGEVVPGMLAVLSEK
ncbi:MAG: hypothetical protein JSR44_13220 [Spirochaetes bacterium]|nr:hypothetical protein [Spirochaetota bacterium]